MVRVGSVSIPGCSHGRGGWTVYSATTRVSSGVFRSGRESRGNLDVRESRSIRLPGTRLGKWGTVLPSSLQTERQETLKGVSSCEDLYPEEVPGVSLPKLVGIPETRQYVSTSGVEKSGRSEGPVVVWKHPSDTPEPPQWVGKTRQRSRPFTPLTPCPWDPPVDEWSVHTVPLLWYTFFCNFRYRQHSSALPILCQAPTPSL